MNNTGFIITIAYPETIVRVSSEWIVSKLYLMGFGKKNYIRAGHAALVLIDKNTGILEYFDFGRYVTPNKLGRVRSQLTDHELSLPLSAKINKDEITNLDDILYFLATQPKLTHGEGTMVASVCHQIDYTKAKNLIESMQNNGMMKYAAFGKTGSNCSRFVTDILIESINNESIKNKLVKSTWFTPSTIGNVLIADTQKQIYSVLSDGQINTFKSSKMKENMRLFLDRLKHHEPNFEGNLESKSTAARDEKAQWLSGVGGGAWFEIHSVNESSEYRFKRISPNGNIDVDGIYSISSECFDIKKTYEFMANSNCDVFHIKQEENIYRFNFIRIFESINSRQMERSI
ncbi:MAG: DUF6695 family protein [Aquaticitalea sp.]